MLADRVNYYACILNSKYIVNLSKDEKEKHKKDLFDLKVLNKFEFGNLKISEIELVKQVYLNMINKNYKIIECFTLDQYKKFIMLNMVKTYHKYGLFHANRFPIAEVLNVLTQSDNQRFIKVNIDDFVYVIFDMYFNKKINSLSIRLNMEYHVSLFSEPDDITQFILDCYLTENVIKKVGEESFKLIYNGKYGEELINTIKKINELKVFNNE